MAEGIQPVEQSVQLTPFVERMSDNLEGLLRSVLGLGQGIELMWHFRADDDAAWRVHLRIEQDLEFDLYPQKLSHRQLWFEGQHLCVGYRRPRQDDTQTASHEHILDQLHRRFIALDAVVTKNPLLLLKRAIESHGKYDQISDWMYREVSPREAIIRLGFRCNQDCAFCWQDRKWPEPPADYYHRWLDELSESGCSYVTFSGGEPTIHKELLPLVERAAKTHGMMVHIQTNAVRMAKPGFAEKVRNAGAEGLFVSFHSHLAEISDVMTRAPKTHVRTEQGIKNALACGLKVELNCVVEQRNFELLGDHARHIVETYVTPFPENPPRKVAFSHPCQYYSEDEWKRGLVPLDELQPYLVDAVMVLDSAGVPVEGIGTCGFPPCILKDTPNLQRFFTRTEEAPQDVSGRLFAEPCHTCAMQPHCLGIRREYRDTYGARGLVPFETLPSNSDQ